MFYIHDVRILLSLRALQGYFELHFKICFSGELTALSIDTLLDIDDCAAVTPKGFLVLSLNNDTFLKLGVDKGPSVALIRQKAANKIRK